MNDRLLLGAGRRMMPVPGFIWRRLVRANARKVETSLGFMSEEHHRVRDFVVLELPRARQPLTPAVIAAALGLTARARCASTWTRRFAVAPPTPLVQGALFAFPRPRRS